ncbi:MAG: hypothetical protein ACJ8AO_15725 [Gemmatimonadaceae bacterium]
MPGRTPASARALVLALAAVAAAGGRARAQSVLGPFEDATPAPRGMLRFGAVAAFTHYSERFGPDGTVGPYYGLLNADTLGVRQLPQLASVQEDVRTLAASPKLSLTLGPLAVRSRTRVVTLPLQVEMGLTSRLSVGVTAPYVRSYNTVVAELGSDPGAGNIGINPALDPGQDGDAARDANEGVYQDLEDARAQLAALLAACSANPSGAGCAAINADPAAAQALVNESAAFAAALARVYGLTSGARSPFVPSLGSVAAQAVSARLVGFDSLYRAFLGRSTSVIGGRPVSALPPAQGTLQQALGDTAVGIVSGPLDATRRSHFGDIEVGAKLLLLDSFGGSAARRIAPRPGSLNYRLAVGALVRLGTGQADDPNDPTDVPTGGGQTDVGVRAIADVLVGSRAWASVVARYERQLPDEPTVRVAAQELFVFAPLYSRQLVSRDLGDVFALEVTPRLVATQNLALAAHYEYTEKASDVYTGTFTVDSATTGFGALELDAAVLGENTAERVQRWGLGATYSTLADYYRGRTRLPLEVSYLHRRTAAATRGWVPRTATDELTVRLYFRLFGPRPPRASGPARPRAVPPSR